MEPLRLDELAARRGALRTVAVTGTNGKSTTTSMVASIVAAAGEPDARVTTLGAWVRGACVADGPTYGAFARAVEACAREGVRTLALEVTSKALAEGFARAWPADVAVFTNLSRDHLDYHGTPERYLAAKAQLFVALAPGSAVAVLNAADPASSLLDEITPGGVPRRAFAARPVDPACAGLPRALAAARVTAGRDGTRVELAPSPLADRLGGALELGVVGAVHAENALAAAVAADAAGYGADAIARGLRAFAGVPGRFERVGSRPLVVVDYAHTPDALARTLAQARALAGGSGAGEVGDGDAPRARGRVVCVFGCGGDRDAGKRSEMGRVADEGADVVVLTTDNPRTEDPRAIAAAVRAGAVGGAARWVDEPDRARAIALAVGAAGERDIVVVAGKGHEREQVFADRSVPFSDAEVAREALRARRAAGERDGEKRGES